jgi:hypothetical protein
MSFHPLLRRPPQRNLQLMKRHQFSNSRILTLISGLMIFVAGPACAAAEPTQNAIAAFNTYIAAVESRLAQQHRSQSAFLVPTPQTDARLRSGELIVEQVSNSDLPGALLHHWRGTAFAPGATAVGFERLMRDFNSYPQHFSPDVLEAKTLAKNNDRLQAFMRVRQHHVITVVMDTTYEVDFERLDLHHGYSISQSTKISEIASPGTPSEHALTSSEDHGFLWRQNTYWSYEERDGGLYMQIESVSLSRSIPRGLGWAVRPFVESVPRESLEFTLRSACAALRK